MAFPKAALVLSALFFALGGCSLSAQEAKLTIIEKSADRPAQLKGAKSNWSIAVLVLGDRAKDTSCGELLLDYPVDGKNRDGSEKTQTASNYFAPDTVDVPVGSDPMPVPVGCTSILGLNRMKTKGVPKLDLVFAFVDKNGSERRFKAEYKNGKVVVTHYGYKLIDGVAEPTEASPGTGYQDDTVLFNPITMTITLRAPYEVGRKRR
jgi:hypothetical protein